MVQGMAGKLYEFQHPDENEVIRAFAANPAFRSAEADELVNYDDPLRRPVRPHDLELLDYRRILPRDELLTLSALLGHRMLINAYETEYPFLPDPSNGCGWQAFQDFYCTESAMLGVATRPILERHLFAVFEQGSDHALTGGPVDLLDALAATEERLRERTMRLAAVVGALRDRGAATVFALVQQTCGWRARSYALARGTLGDHVETCLGLDLRVGELSSEIARANVRLRELLVAAELSPKPRAYWQFYLTSTLARANNLYRLARDHERFLQFAGALAHEQMSLRAFHELVEPVIAQELGVVTDRDPVVTAGDQGGSPLLQSRLLTPLVDMYGVDTTVVPILEGLAVADELHALAQEDLRRQLVWADQLECSSAEAARLQHLIDGGDLRVDLDTFVESSEETSTTHVHDEHRLVVIESGEMVFWNNVGARIALSAGEMLLVPRTRLHGSVVLSGQCTYHQPIIPEEALLLSFE